MSTSTDAMYNAGSRYIHQKFLIYFSTINPLEVLTSNYLQASTILEEAYKISGSPFGDVTSNELNLDLINRNDIFNPENVDGPYYGLIKRGVKIETFIKPDEVSEWDPQGVFYVTEWFTSASGMIAEVTAHDKIYDIINAPVPKLSVYKNNSFATFMNLYLAEFNTSANIDSTIQFNIPYGFTSGYGSNKKLLLDLMISAKADCFCNHEGNIVIKSKTSARDTRATLSDADQIISVSIRQSIDTDYDSAIVKCNERQEGEEENILAIAAMALQPGVNVTKEIEFIATPVLEVRSIHAVGDNRIIPQSFQANADTIIFSLSSNLAQKAKVDVIGCVLEKVVSTVTSDGDSPVLVDSNFIQSKEHAQDICDFVDDFVNTDISTLELTIRGNPKLQIGDKIAVNSTRYKTNYTGILTQAKYIYRGYLTCDIVLVDASLVEEE